MKSLSPPPLPVVSSLTRLGQAISLARRRRHLTQQDFAQQIGTSAHTLRRMEAGHPGTALLHLARALQVFEEAVDVLHCFHKKTQATSKQDKDIAEARYRAVVNARKAKK